MSVERVDMAWLRPAVAPWKDDALRTPRSTLPTLFITVTANDALIVTNTEQIATAMIRATPCSSSAAEKTEPHTAGAVSQSVARVTDPMLEALIVASMVIGMVVEDCFRDSWSAMDGGVPVLRAKGMTAGG